MTGGATVHSDVIVLVGYRGTGKSTVGRLLAERLGWTFFDTDDHVEAAAGKSIREIFATDGEFTFRERESESLAQLCKRISCVIATGGGAVLRESNRELLKNSGFVAWLTARPETVLARLQSDPTTGERRPNLTAAGGEEEVRALIAFREPLYRAVASCEVATDALTPEALTDAILSAWAEPQRDRGADHFDLSSGSGC
ncbi:shikimate kinase [Gemmata sp. JC673]|uniref:Shikimate kinase n=1 Tax=Gemmata algarum TaxID=2975278 RepID=A0ABU5ERG8_9BACT|nr:shikimate kinase [Gemmata algarum]MDY3557928.1 shikimate kinase [Gemmata algarum]